MTERAARGSTGLAPLPLRLVHLAVFAGLTFAGLRATWPEVLELFRSLGAAYRPGDPPDLFAAAAFLALAVLGLLLLARALRGRVPLPLSAAVLVAFALAYLAARAEPEGRSPIEADRRILFASERYFAELNEALQKGGEAPREPEAWRAPLEELGQGPVRHRLSRLPFRLWLSAPDAALPTPVPGTMYVQISNDRASFTLRPAGFDPEGRPAFLTDAQGRPLVLRAVYNPNRR